jgi:hypothetical protein
MVTETAPLTTCPTCGVEIKQTHLSLCAYCGSPLDLKGSERPPVDRATIRRLNKMKEQDAYAAAMAWDPPETLDVQSAVGRRTLADAALVTGGLLVLLGVWPLLAGAPSALGWAALVLGALAVGWGILTRLMVSKKISEAGSAPLMRRPAIVADRRSETEVDTGQTTYFFLLQFDDGSEAEFCFPGRGASHDPFVPGNTGLAYTRRMDLLAFRGIRV